MEAQDNILQDGEGSLEMLIKPEETAVPEKVEDNKTKNVVSANYTQPDELKHVNKVLTDITQDVAIKKIVDVQSKVIEFNEIIFYKENTQSEKVVENSVSTEERDVEMKVIQYKVWDPVPEIVEENKPENFVYPDHTQAEKIKHVDKVSADSTQNIERKTLIDVEKSIEKKEVFADNIRGVAMKEIQNDEVTQEIPNYVPERNTQVEEIKATENNVSADCTQDVEIKQIENVKVSQDSTNENQETSQDKNDYKVHEDNTGQEKVESMVYEVSTKDVQNIELLKIENNNLVVTERKLNRVSKDQEQSDKVKHVENNISKDVTQDVEMEQVEDDKVSREKLDEKTVLVGNQRSKETDNAMANNNTLSLTKPEETELRKIQASKKIHETIILKKSDKSEPKKDTKVKNVQDKVSKDDIEMRPIENDNLTQDNEKTMIDNAKSALNECNKTVDVPQSSKIIEKSELCNSRQCLNTKSEGKLCTDAKPFQDKGHFEKSEVNITSKGSQNNQTKENTLHNKSVNTAQLKEAQNEAEIQPKVVKKNDDVSDVSTNKAQASASLSSSNDDLNYMDIDEILDGIDLDELTKDDEDIEVASEPLTINKHPENNIKVKKAETSFTSTPVKKKLRDSSPIAQKSIIKCLCPTLYIKNFPGRQKLAEIRNQLICLLEQHIMFGLHIMSKPIIIGQHSVGGLILEFSSAADCKYAYNILKGRFVMGVRLEVYYFTVKKKMLVIKHGGPNFHCYNNRTMANKLKLQEKFGNKLNESVNRLQEKNANIVGTPAESATNTTHSPAAKEVAKKQGQVDIHKMTQNPQQKVEHKNVNISDVLQNKSQESELISSKYDDLCEADHDQAVDDIVDGIDLDELAEEEGEAAGEPQTSSKQPSNNIKVRKNSIIKCHCPTLQIQHFPSKLKPHELKHYLRDLLQGEDDFYLHKIERPITLNKYTYEGMLVEFKSQELCTFAYMKWKNQVIMGSQITVYYCKEFQKMQIIKHGGPNFDCCNNKMQEKALKRALQASVDTSPESAAKKFKTDTSTSQTPTSQTPTSNTSTSHTSKSNTSLAQERAQAHVPPADTVTNNEDNYKRTTSAAGNKYDRDGPFGMQRVRWRRIEMIVNRKETYGLSLKFLESLGIRPPLFNKIRVTEVNPLVTIDHKDELMEIFSLAGDITDIYVTTPKGIRTWFVEYKHPLEAVQAVSLFNGQKICGFVVNVKLCRAVGMCLPRGLESIGPGLGRKNFPLPYPVQKIEIQSLKRAIQGVVDTTGDKDDEGDIAKEMFDFGPNYQACNPQSTQNSYNQQSNAYNAVNQYTNNSNAANTRKTQTNQPTALLSVLMSQLNKKSLSKDTAASLKEQLLSLAQMVDQTAGQSTENYQSHQPTFTPNQLPSSAGLQNQYTAPAITSPATANYNPFQNQVNPGLEWNTNLQMNPAVAPQMPFGDTQAAMYNQALMQQQLQMHAAMQQYQLSTAASQQQIVSTPATPAAMQTMMNPQWALQQTNVNVVTQQSLNLAPAQQPNLSPAVTQQQNLKTKQPKQPISSTQKNYSAEPVPYKKQQQNIQNQGLTTQSANEPVKKHSYTLHFKNLPPSVTCDALLTKMKEVGDVLFCEMIGKGQAMVHFKHDRHAEKCYKLFNLSKVDGQVIEVKFV